MTKDEFAEMVLESTDSLYRVSKGILKNDSDCEDAVWEAVSIGFAKLPALRQKQYARTWLIRILIHECYRILQEKKRFADADARRMSGRTIRNCTNLCSGWRKSIGFLWFCFIWKAIPCERSQASWRRRRERSKAS